MFRQENAKTTSELSKVLESTRAHLQGQLRSKESENNRLGVQIKVKDECVYVMVLIWKQRVRSNVSIHLKKTSIKHWTTLFSFTIPLSPLLWLVQNLERAASQQRGEIDHLQGQLRGMRERADADKEALKRATRAQKHRAERSEDAAGQLSAQLTEIVSQQNGAEPGEQRGESGGC